jgi:hypothetical protein
VKLPEIILTFLVLTGGCGGASKPTALKTNPKESPRYHPIAVEAPTAKRSAGMKVTGITGSLNRGDVHQTIEKYYDALLQCVAQRPRRLGWVAGRIDFHFKVGPAGQVVEINPTASTIGYHKLELCLKDVVAHISFPAPSGGDKTEFDWGMDVDPLSGQPVADLEPERIEKSLARYVADTYDTCEVPQRTRFEVTAYLGPQGNVLAAGTIPKDKKARDKVACMLEEMAGWRLSRPKKRSKVSFTLKWQPRPPKAKKRVKKSRALTRTAQAVP